MKKDSDKSALDDIFDAYSLISQQQLKPNTIVMSPESVRAIFGRSVPLCRGGSVCLK